MIIGLILIAIFLNLDVVIAIEGNPLPIEISSSQSDFQVRQDRNLQIQGSSSTRNSLYRQTQAFLYI